MNETQQKELTSAVQQAQRGTKRTAGLWFRWWIAACLVLLAVSSYQQLQIQRRILAQSQELQAAVAEAATVSAVTNQQLNGLGKLDGETSRLAAELKHMVTTNAAIKNELAGMEASVRSVGDSVASLDRLNQDSAAQLADIARKSADLQAVLDQSQATGRTVSSMLTNMADVQDEVTANLGAMVDKTMLLQRFAGGD